MKKLFAKNNWISLILTGLFSCHSGVPEKQADKPQESPYSQALDLLHQRIKADKAGDTNSNLLNLLAIQKFTQAYQNDTTNTNAAMLASECCMYSRKYADCIHWLKIVSLRDSSQADIADNSQSLGLCYAGLGDLASADPYFNRANKIWKEILPSSLKLIPANLAIMSQHIYESNDKNLVAKGIDPCAYSIRLLEYADSVGKSKSYKTLIAERKTKCL